MATIVRYFCDCCGVEDGRVQSWRCAPTWVSDSSNRVDFVVCDLCLPLILRGLRLAVSGQSKPKGWLFKWFGII